jgi:hypothetical protein
MSGKKTQTDKIFLKTIDDISKNGQMFLKQYGTSLEDVRTTSIYYIMNKEDYKQSKSNIREFIK